MARFIRFPWANSGDRVVVPDEVDPSGGVSYAQGFGPDYERDPATDPLAKRVPRDGTNGYLFDLSENIRQYQLAGVPEWFPASANAGISIAYPLNALVRRADIIYRSIVPANVSEPGVPGSEGQWVVDTLWGEATVGNLGVVRLATNAEAAAKLATDRVLTPSNLAGVQFGISNSSYFSASGNFIVPAGITRVFAKVIGGGGGGGIANTSYRHGGGGGGGGVAEGFIAVTPGATMPITVGSGGAGGAAGGSSTFGGLSATGGLPGGMGPGGASGIGSGGGLNYGLGDGGTGSSSTDAYGAGTGGGAGGGQGRPGRAPGAGGGGAYDSGGGGSMPAGAGAPGAVILQF